MIERVSIALISSGLYTRSMPAAESAFNPAITQRHAAVPSNLLAPRATGARDWTPGSSTLATILWRLARGFGALAIILCDAQSAAQSRDSTHGGVPYRLVGKRAPVGPLEIALCRSWEPITRKGFRKRN